MPRPYRTVGNFRIAPFKTPSKGPYGPFANTTNRYPVKQTVKIAGQDETFNWPSSEHAFHAQKILHLLQKEDQTLSADQKKDLTTALRNIENTNSGPTEEFRPRADYEKVVNDLLKADNSFGANKNEFDARCEAHYHPTGLTINLLCGPGMGLNPMTKEPYTTEFMRTVLKLKFEQHPELNELAIDCAREGIMPVETSGHDASWAAGVDGDGANRLGILILELGNDGLTKLGGTPAIQDPKNYYDQIKKAHENDLTHDKLDKAQFEDALPAAGTKPATLTPAANTTTTTTTTSPHTLSKDNLAKNKNPASPTVEADPVVIQEIITKYDAIAKEAGSGKYKPGFSAPKKQADGRLKVDFPDNKGAKNFFATWAKDNKEFSVSNDKGQIIAYSNGDGKLYGGDHKELSAADASDWKATPETDFKNFPFKKPAEPETTRPSP